MCNLFIIGNGFDLAHGLKTSYEHFRQYLNRNYPNARHTFSYVPESGQMPDGDVYIDEDEVVGFLLHIISEAEPEGEKWSDLESSVGYLEFSEFLDKWEEDEEDDNYNEWDDVYRNQDLSSNISGAVLKIIDYFSKWINTICLDDVQPKADFKKLIHKDVLFLNFNYTRTLEEIYDVKEVCHIHGVQGGELLFGHGNDKDYYEDNMSRYVGSEDALQEVQRQLKKDTNNAINDNMDFFDRLISISNIFSYGFSFSKVDEVYVRKICCSMPTKNVTWYLNDFDSIDQRKRYKEILRSCGFEGIFKDYHIS